MQSCERPSAARRVPRLVVARNASSRGLRDDVYSALRHSDGVALHPAMRQITRGLLHWLSRVTATCRADEIHGEVQGAQEDIAVDKVRGDNIHEIREILLSTEGSLEHLQSVSVELRQLSQQIKRSLSLTRVSTKKSGDFTLLIVILTQVSEASLPAGSWTT